MLLVFRLLLFVLLYPLSLSLSADPRLPSIVGDGMILQRDVPLNIWGWADLGETVTVTFLDRQYRTEASLDGTWQIRLEPMSSGGPYTMDIMGKSHITLKDILVGDVWICSGQSNMAHYFGRHRERYAKEIAEADVPEIRQFFVPTTAVLEGPLEDIPGLKWKRSTPENIIDFTVVGYFFAKELYDTYKVPQGIINTSVGGTQIEAWTSEEGFKDFPQILKTIERNKDRKYIEKMNAAARADREADGPKKTKDKGTAGELKWFDPDYQPLNWKRINIPGYWEDQGIRDLDGVVWYRREIDVPESMCGVEGQIKLGRIRNADEVFVNGERIGGTTYEYPQREYSIPTGTLKPGKNLVVVRVTNDSGKGGFIPDKPYLLTAGGNSIDLKGDWLSKVGEAFRKTRPYKQEIRAQDQPTSLYNGMIAPFVNYGLRGFLWYQGESNSGDPESYRKLLPNLINDWRSNWQLGDLVFLIAQLPNFMDVDYLPAESNWALMREAQLDTALKMPNAGIGLNIDLGEWNDIHPGNKKPVGERLALQAMSLSYGESDLVASGPIYQSHRIEGNRIVLSFDYVGSGLVANNGEPLDHFAIAGKDLEFVWAEAIIENDHVIVWSDEIPDPKYVRYAWADNPDFANLYNKEGLPASPFRTDKK